MHSKAQLVKQCKKIAEDNFDNQMLELLDVIKTTIKLHSQHKFTLLNYIEADKRRVEI